MCSCKDFFLGLNGRALVDTPFQPFVRKFSIYWPTFFLCWWRVWNRKRGGRGSAHLTHQTARYINRKLFWALCVKINWGQSLFCWSTWWECHGWARSCSYQDSRRWRYDFLVWKSSLIPFPRSLPVLPPRHLGCRQINISSKSNAGSVPTCPLRMGRLTKTEQENWSLRICPCMSPFIFAYHEWRTENLMYL